MSETDKRKHIDYLRRCYRAVDGLWFVKTEERWGLETAFELDEEVWKVMAKIQAREAAKACSVSRTGLLSLKSALELKFKAEGYRAEVSLADNGNHLAVSIQGCPWFELLKRSGHLERAEEIADRICKMEYRIWGAEFNVEFQENCVLGLCTGCEACKFEFQRSFPGQSVEVHG